jgi:hypothetical protein
MAEQAAILVGSKRGAQIGDLELDCTITERHAHRATPTRQPVEDGAVFSDHVIQEPDALTLDGLWTDTPNGAQEGKLARSKELYLALVALKEKGEPVDVVTGLRVYQSMIVTDIQTSKDSTTGFSVPVSITLEPIRIARQQTTQIPPEAIAASARHSATKKDAGRRSTTPASDAAKNKGSILHGLLF